MLDNFKTFVARQTGNAAGNALTTGAGGAAASSFQQALAQAVQMSSKLFEEREWQCPCGHKFRAPGEWIATVPIYCEVPSCPNPKYYVDGPGRALLEANPSGVKLNEVKPSQAAAGNSQTKGIASRFGPKN